MPNWVVLLQHVLLAALVAGAMTGGFWWLFRDVRIAALGFVISLPVVAKLLAKPVLALASEGFGWLARQPLQAWQGAYYAFDGQHVRVYTHDDELWFVARDVLAATGIAKMPRALVATLGRSYRTIPGTRHQGMNVDAIRKLLAPRREPEAGRFLFWVEREVVRPWERKRGAPLSGPA